ncbi:MAG: hypothetical protein WC685_05580 [Methylobacter sp.]|jgi:hypothetical protein
MNGTLHKARICLMDKNSGEAFEHIAEFTGDEWRQLHDFLMQVADLKSTQFVVKGNGIQLYFDWKEGSEPLLRVKTPSDDEVGAFLHRLRPLILQREPASFNKVSALLKRRLGANIIKPFMRELLEIYEGKRMQGQIEIQSKGSIMNSEKMLVAWLNAYEYHRDRDKQELLETHNHIMLTPEWSRGMFLTLLIEKTNAISYLGTLVEHVLGKRDAFWVNL